MLPNYNTMNAEGGSNTPQAAFAILKTELKIKKNSSTQKGMLQPDATCFFVFLYDCNRLHPLRTAVPLST